MSTKRTIGLFLVAVGILGFLYSVASLAMGDQQYNLGLKILYVVLAVAVFGSGFQMVRTSEEA